MDFERILDAGTANSTDKQKAAQRILANVPDNDPEEVERVVDQVAKKVRAQKRQKKHV